MAKHETTTAAKGTTSRAIIRPLTEIDPKVLAGFASSISVGAIITAGKAVGLAIPTWLALLIVILVYLVTAYITKTRIPVPDDSGLTVQQAALVNGASAVGAELSEEDYRAAAQAAFEAAGIALDDGGKAIDESHPLIAGDSSPHPTD